MVYSPLKPMVSEGYFFEPIGKSQGGTNDLIQLGQMTQFKTGQLH